jgi:hypothetical protein
MNHNKTPVSFFVPDANDEQNDAQKTIQKAFLTLSNYNPLMQAMVIPPSFKKEFFLLKVLYDAPIDPDVLRVINKHEAAKDIEEWNAYLQGEGDKPAFLELIVKSRNVTWVYDAKASLNVDATPIADLFTKLPMNCIIKYNTYGDAVPGMLADVIHLPRIPSKKPPLEPKSGDVKVLGVINNAQQSSLRRAPMQANDLYLDGMQVTFKKTPIKHPTNLVTMSMVRLMKGFDYIMFCYEPSELDKKIAYVLDVQYFYKNTKNVNVE